MSGSPFPAATRVSARQLPFLPRGKDEVSREVACIVTRVQMTRAREFVKDGVVFNFDGTDLTSKETIHMYFYDDWARAASFVSVGDEVILQGFQLHDVATTPLGSSSGSGGDAMLIVTPSSGLSSLLTVAQPAEQGDVIDVVVNPAQFDNPTAKVRKGVHGVTGGGMVLHSSVPSKH